MANSEDIVFVITVSRRAALVVGIDKIARLTICNSPIEGQVGQRAQSFRLLEGGAATGDRNNSI